jgi:hypothetical protein
MNYMIPGRFYKHNIRTNILLAGSKRPDRDFVAICTRLVLINRRIHCTTQIFLTKDAVSKQTAYPVYLIT